MQNLNQRARNCKLFIENVENDVLPALVDLGKQQAPIFARVKSEGLRAQKNRLVAQASHDKLLERYGRICGEAERLSTQMYTSQEYPPQERSKLAAKLINTCHDATTAEDSYSKAVTGLNDANKEYHVSIGAVVDALEELELSRHLCVKEAMTKFTVYRASWLRSVQYDQEGSMLVFDGMSGKADLDKFVDAYRSERPRAVDLVRVHWWQVIICFCLFLHLL